MDRDGESLVAIVQGLDSPGVTVTVSSRSRHDVERRRSSKARIHINTVNRAKVSPAADHDTMPATPGEQSASVSRRASVKTTTDADFAKLSKGSQICDDRYTSSYKLAHCQMTPTSPPEAVSEYPLQRRDPCRNEGNFEISRNRSAQSSFHIEYGSGQSLRQQSRNGQVRASTSRIRQNGGSLIWRDKGSSHRHCNPKRDLDAFEQSLRKYPSMSPLRTASHDLIEKLIRYTQAKNFQEMSRSSKSMRSLRHQKSTDTKVMQSKQQQTYTRRQDNNLPSSSGVQVGHVGRTRNFKLYSPTSDSRNIRNRETAFSTSYDYLNAGSPPDGRPNRSDGSPSPTGSRSPVDSRSPDRSSVRFGSPVGSKGPGSLDRSRRPERPIRFERSVRDLSLSEMSKYIRSTVRQICNEKKLVYQMCPKLKNRYDQHKRTCPSKNEQTSNLAVLDFEEDDARASSSVLSRLIRSFSEWSTPWTDTGCQCKRSDCHCARATQCAYDSEVPTKTVGCSCRTRTIEAKTSCQRDLACVCTRKAEELAYYYKKIDEAISIWLKDVPVHNIECTANKRKRETAIKKLRQILKQLPDDEDFDENVRNEVSCFVDDFPLWNPGKDEDEENMFKNQLVDKLIDTILAIPRKPDRFREIVTKWVESLDFEDNDEEIEMEAVIDNFVNKLNPLAADRPACDMKYMQILRKEITELLIVLPLSYDSVMFKRKAHQLATEIVNLPRNIKLSGSTTSTNVFEENISEWVCEHGMCRELKKDPKLIESLANKLKSQGIGDEEVIETMKELISEFVDDVDTAIGVLDEFVDELMKTFPSFVQKGNLYSELNAERFDVDELHEVVTDWISNLPGASDFFPNKLEEITEDIVTMIHDSIKQGNEDLGNNIFEYIADTGLPIDLGVLHTHVDELMERLNVLPPSEDVIDQAKINMIKEMFKVINASSMSEEKQKELKRSALKLVQRKASMMSSLDFLEDQDDVKEALLSDLNQIMNKILGEGQNEFKDNLRSSLSTTFDKSFVRLGKDESDLKQIVEKKVRKAIDGLPVDTIRKKYLMGQVNKILCKCMNQPLPPNVKNIINDDISNILDKCPISEDRSLCGRLKKTLFDVVGQNLDMLLPKPVCDFQCKTEDDVGMVIDKCPMDPGTKTQLKKCIQDIFTKNGDRLLSEEAVRTVEEEIHGVCSDLPIPKDKKAILVKAVGASVSKNLRDALLSLRHDLNKLRKRLYVTMTNVIEKSPITRDVKTNLKSQIESVLVRNLDSSLSDKEKQNILDEVSIVLKDDMPEEKIKNLTNILSNKMDACQRKEKTKDLAEIITKDVDQLANSLSIDSYAKEDFRKDIKAVLLDTLYNPLTNDTQQKIKKDIINEIDELDIPKNEKNYLKSNVAHAVSKQLNELIAQGKEAPEIATSLEETIRNKIRDPTIPKDKQELLNHKLHDVLANNLVRDVTHEEKEVAKQKLSDIVDDLKIDKGKTKAVKTQLLNDAHKYFEIPSRDRIQTKESIAAVNKNMSDNQSDYQIQNKILQSLENSIDDALIPEVKKNELKTKLKNIIAKNTKEPLSSDATKLTQLALKDLENKTKQNIVRGLENVIAKAPIPNEEKKRLKKQLKDLATQQFKRRLSGDVAVGLKKDMDEIIDEMNLSKTEKDKLKTELTATVDDNISNLRNKTKQKQIEGFKELENETEENIVRGLENVIDAAPMPKEEKIQLMKKLKDLTTQQFKRQLSDDVAEELKDDMAEIIDEMNLPTDTKVKLKSELTATVGDNMSDMHRKIKDADSNFSKTKSKQLEQETQTNIKRRLENVIDVAPIPKQKKIQLMKKLKDLTTQQFKSQLSDDVAEALQNGMVEIIDEMNLPKDTKDKLKSELFAAVDDNMSNLRNKIKPSQQGIDDLKSLKNETKGNIKREPENVVAVAPIPKEKKNELKKQFKDLATQQFKNYLSDDVAVGLKNDRDEFIDEMNLPKDKKIKVKSELNATVDDNMSNLRNIIKPSQKGHVDLKALAKETEVNMARELENVVDAAPIPKEKKIQLIKKLKNLITQQFKSQLSDDVVEGLKDDMGEIIDEMNLPKDTKIKLKSELTATVDDNMSNLRTKTKSGGQGVDGSKSLENETKGNIVRELENVIDAAPIPKEKKKELKKQFKDLATQQFKNHLSDDVAVGLKDDMDEIIDKINLPKDKKMKLKSELNATVDENMSNLRSKTKPSQKGHVDLKSLAKETEVNMAQELENVVNTAPIPKEKKIQLIKKLKNLTTQQFKSQLSDDVVEGLKDDMVEIIDEMNLPKDTKVKLKSELTATVDDNMSDMHRTIKDADSLKSKELQEETQTNIKRRLENVIDAAPIPREKKVELKKKLKELAIQQLNTRLLDDDTAGLKDDMSEIIDNLNLPKDKERRLKIELNDTVDEHNMSEKKRKIKDADSNLRRPGLLSTEENKKKDRILQGIEKVIEKSAIPENKKHKFSGVLQKIDDGHVKKRFSNDVQDKDSIEDDDSTELKVKTQSNILLGQDKAVAKAKLPKELRKYLKNRLKELTNEHFMKPLTDDTAQKLRDDINEEIDDLNLTEQLKDQLKKELDEAVVENMRNLLKHVKALEINPKTIKGLKEIFNKFGIHPSYQKQLAEELNKLLEIASRGGDLEDARRKLIKKLMRDLNLPNEEASAIADELIDKARKMALKEHLRDLLDKYSIDSGYEDQMAEEFNKLLEIARWGGDLENARTKLIQKLVRDLNQSEEEASAVADELIDKARKMAMKEHLRDFFDKYGIDPSYEDQLAEEFNKLLEVACKGGDLDDAKEKLIKILTRDLNLSKAKASSLADDLIARAREIALSGKTTEAFTQAISDAVDQSTVAKADKPILKNRLFSKLKQILNKKPYILKDDIGPLKEEVLKECNEIVDESSIPTDKKNELKQLLKEQLDKASDEDGAAENLADYNDKITKVIQKWMDTLPIHLNQKVAATVADNIASDILHRHKYLHVHPEAKSSEKDEIENLKYQVFRQMYRVVNTKAMPKITERTPDLYKAIMKIKPPPQEPKRLPKPKDAFTKAGRGDVDQKPLLLDEDPLAQKKMKQLLKKIAKSVDQAIVESSLSKPDKITIKKRLMDDLGITWADRKKVEKYDVGPSDAMDKSPTAMEYKIRECVKNWLETLPIDIDPKTAATIADNLTNDILERQKYLRSQLETASTDEDEIENLMFQVFRRLKDIVDPGRFPDILKRTEDLYNMIMNIKKEQESQQGDGRRKNLTPKEAQEFQTTLPDEIAAVLNDYNICCERRELLSSITKELVKLGNSNADQDEIIENLTDAIKRITYLSNCDMCNDDAEDLAYKLLARTKKLIARIQQSKGAPVKRRDFREAVMNDIGDVFHGCPMSADKRNMMECQLAEDYAEDLGIPLQDSEATMTGAGQYGMSFNGLPNFIDTWLSTIHTEDDDDTKEGSEINDKKKDMAYSLIQKIGEMNVDPEIFNDDALYEAILRDELQNMLGDITISEDELEPLKEELINKVLEAKQRAHDEFAGQTYKRKLRDTISKVLPYQRNLSKEEQASLNTLKDQLADAYIDLHFSGNNEPQREKLKRKIFNELSRFCKDYVNKVPCAPLSSKKLNQDLYAALNSVPLPTKDSIRYEVEQARIREEINDWLKELPIRPQNPTELLARNKMVYVLAKKLFDIEIEGNDTDNDSKRSEIVKFLNRLSLETEDDLETLADTLIDKLKETEESRKYIASSNVTLDSFGNLSMDPRLCSKHKSFFEKRKVSPGPSGSQVVCGRPTCKQPKPMPPCTLSPEDKDYLERIRRRNCLSQGCVKSIMKDYKPKTCPGVRSVDTGNQTTQKTLGYRRPRSPICQIADKTPPYSQQRTPCDPHRAPVCPVSQQETVGPCPRLLRASSRCSRQLRKPTISCASDGDEEVQSQITIKKYHWNPNDENAKGNRDPSLRHQASPSRIRISSGAQCSPPPCGRPLSSCKLQQQDTGPQIRSEPKCQRKPSTSFETVTKRSFQPFCEPSPCMGPFGLNNRPSPSSSPFSKRDDECRIPKRDGLDHQDQMPCSSCKPSRKERVIKLGSLDNLSNPRPEKRHNDANDWCFEDEEDDNFWCSPIRRVILDEGIDDSVVMEREQTEERMRCNCKERLVPKSQGGRAQSGNFPSQQFTQGNDVGPNLKKCSKCCGRHCPYPSYLYFRQ